MLKKCKIKKGSEKPMKKLFVLLFIFSAALSFGQQNVSAPQKFALVIGNGAYGSGLSRLNNPVNDANDMTAALQSLGFTVDKVLDGNLDQMETAITRLKNRLSVQKNTYGFFFYAGHGVQSDGVNYLIPVGVSIPSANYLRDRAVSVQAMLGELNDAGNELNVVVLDACRDNPFSWARSGGGRGLTVVSNQPADSIIVYATSAGSTASDGTGRNGLFTERLLKNLKTPGLEISEVFRLTGADVAQASERKQIPAVYNQFFGRAYFGPQPVAVTAPLAQPAPAPQPAPAAAPAPAPTPTPAAQPTPAPATTASRPAASTTSLAPTEMVRINAGTFTMGTTADEIERYNVVEVPSQRQVTVSSFYMGKYEVTQKEYLEVTGTNPSYFKGDTLPVESVSWYDAVEYCNRRSQREGLTPAYAIDGNDVTWNQNANGYRLPTEAEWEYACRAGTVTSFSTGNNITTGQANYNGNFPFFNNAKGRYRERTTKVGSFKPNPWGLYDMHGNVSEWCWDLLPSGERIDRGGNWGSPGGVVRSARPNSEKPTLRGSIRGFRVARNGG
jgi:formylglycine-generating enzyme required for sulfatase activity